MILGWKSSVYVFKRLTGDLSVFRVHFRWLFFGWLRVKVLGLLILVKEVPIMLFILLALNEVFLIILLCFMVLMRFDKTG